MGLTKRKDGYYIEFHVMDDGKTLFLAPLGSGKLKRWKVGSGNRRAAQDQEAVIKTRLMTGRELSPSLAKAQTVTFREWAEVYLGLEEVKKLNTYVDRQSKVRNLVEFFGDTPLSAITPEDVARYRAARVQFKRISCPNCGETVSRIVCHCGWEREDAGMPASMQTINHDHTALTHMFNVAKSHRFKLLADNPASHIEKPDPRNERDRIATSEEWERMQSVAAPHLKRFLTLAYEVGPRRGELLRLEWPDVDMKRKEFTLRHTKNGETRTVPMTPVVYEVFLQLWTERRLDTNRVFLYKGKPWRNPRTAFAAACRRAGIKCGRTGGGLTLHDFRHTASTRLRRAGVDTMTAMKIVGHKSEQMHRRYNTFQPADLHEAAAKLHRYAANTLITPPISELAQSSASAGNHSVGA